MHGSMNIKFIELYKFTKLYKFTDEWRYYSKHVEQCPDIINCLTLHLVGYIYIGIYLFYDIVVI